MKPLFVQLKTAYFRAFEAGTKTEEFRPAGPRWNANTCKIGRRAVLSHGYGTAERLDAIVTGYRETMETPPGWRECYGNRPGPVACIRFRLVIDPQCEACAAVFPGPGQICPECVETNRPGGPGL